MLAGSVDRILARLRASDLVLDVGGWACPFNRAQWILDAEPYATRGFYRTFGGPPFQGPETESFSAATWVQRDMCARAAWPFPDKHFDFVVCSQTLEDIRDPIGVCAELMRVGKAGYIEVPTRAFESCRGVERPRLAGLSHHRWLIEISGNHLRFLQKLHTIHESRFSLPPRYRRQLTQERSAQWLIWEDSFTFEEWTIHGLGAQEAELQRFVQATFPQPAWRLELDSIRRQAAAFPGRVLRAIQRRL